MQIQMIYLERKFTQNIKIFLQLYMIKADLLTYHQDLVRGDCYYTILS